MNQINSDGLDCQASRQTHLPLAFKSYSLGDILLQGRMHTFIPPDDSFRTKVSPRMEYIIPRILFRGIHYFAATAFYSHFAKHLLLRCKQRTQLWIGLHMAVSESPMTVYPASIVHCPRLHHRRRRIVYLSRNLPRR